MDKDPEFTDYVAGAWQRLLRSAVLLGCSLAEAEDVAQATLVTCYLKWHLVQRTDSRDAYVATVLINVLRETRRRRSATERPLAVVPDVAHVDLGPDWATQVADVDAVRRALAELSQDHRDVVTLRFYLQLSERECADVLRVAPGTVKSRLSRAIAALAGSVELASFRSTHRSTEGDTP